LTDTNGNVIGNYKHYGKLSVVLANKCGHSVPQGQPWTANYLINLWIEDGFLENFEDFEELSNEYSTMHTPYI